MAQTEQWSLDWRGEVKRISMRGERDGLEGPLFRFLCFLGTIDVYRKEVNNFVGRGMCMGRGGNFLMNRSPLPPQMKKILIGIIIIFLK